MTIARGTRELPRQARSGVGRARVRRPGSAGSPSATSRLRALEHVGACQRARWQRHRSGTLASVANLTRDKIIDAWARLGELAHAEGKSIDIIVVGGAVMAVYFQSRASTADVDGIFAPAPETRRWAQTVADELDLPSDWLNDGVKGYLTGESEGPVLHRSAGIVVRTVAFAHLLALKLMAWRDDVDFSDALRILQALKEQPGTDCSSPEKLSELVEPYFIPSRASYALGELWELHDPAGEDRNSDPSEEPV